VTLVTAYDTRTGQKLGRQVPAHWVGHPRFGPHWSLTPRQKAADKKAAPAADTTTDAPVSGDKKE
jgi:hypothetical protein